MSFDSPIAETRLRNAARLILHGTWLLFLIAAVLLILVRGVPARTLSLWILGCAVIALALSFALRDMVRKVGRRNTEDQIMRDVQTFLETQPAAHDAQPSGPAAVVLPVGPTC